MEKRCIFDVNLVDGNTILQLVKSHKLIPGPFPLVFSEDGITLLSETDGIIIRSRIDHQQTCKFVFNKDLINDKERGLHVIFINGRSLHDQIGTMSKKEGIMMWQEENSNEMKVGTYSFGEGKNVGSILIENTSKIYRSLDTSHFSRKDSDPSCRLPLQWFVSSMKKINRIRISKAKIAVGDNTFTIGASSNSGVLEKDFIWGEEDGKIEINSSEIKTMLVSKNVINVFVHLNGLSNGGIIRVYAEPLTDIIRFSTNIGYYGPMDIYIHSVED